MQRTVTPAPSSDLPGAVYARISGEYDKRFASLDEQVRCALEALQGDGVSVPDEYVFREQDTGHESIDERDGLVRLRSLVAEGKIRAIACYDTDRLARDARGLMRVVDECHTARVRVFFRDEPAQDSPMGMLMLHLRGFASDWEYRKIKERTTVGRKKIKDRGQNLGNGYPRFGYRWILEERRRVADEGGSADVVRLIFERVGREGWSLASVCRDFNARGVASPAAYRGARWSDGRRTRWTTATMRKIVRDETYLGIATSDRLAPHPTKRKRWVPRPKEEWRVLEDGRTEALVDRDLWDLANRATDANRKGERTRNEQTFCLLRGLIFCGECGHLMNPQPVRQWSGEQHLSYRCTSRYRHDTGCRGARVYAKHVEGPIWERVVAVVKDEEIIEAEVVRMKRERPGEKLHRETLTSYKEGVAKLDRKIANFTDALGEADSKAERDSIRDRIRTAQVEHDDLVAAADKVARKLAAYDAMDAWAASLKERLALVRAGLDRPEAFPPDERRKVLEWLRVKVTGNGRNVKLKLDLGPDAAPLVSPEPSGRTTAETYQWSTLTIAVPLVAESALA